MIYQLTDLIHEKLLEAGFNMASYGEDGGIDLNDHSLLPCAHSFLFTSETSNFNQISFAVVAMDILSSTSELDTSEMTNAYKHVSNLIDVQHDLNVKCIKFLRLLKLADTSFYQRLENKPVFTWNEDYGKNRLGGYEFELIFNVENPDC